MNTYFILLVEQLKYLYAWYVKIKTFQGAAECKYLI